MSDLERRADIPVRQLERNSNTECNGDPKCNGGLENPPSVERDSDNRNGMSWNVLTIPLENSQYFETLNGLWNGKKEPFVGAGVIRNTNFTPSGVIDYSNVAYLKVEEKQLLKRRLEAGDIIIERSGGGPKQPVGRVVFFDREDGDFSFSNFTSAVRVKDKSTFDPRFVFYNLMELYQSGRTEDIQRRTTGIRNLDFTAFKERACIPKLPLDEQKKIAHILLTVQQAIEAQERIIQTTTELKKALMHKLFTEGLHNEPQKKTEIGLVPESWVPIALGKLCEKPNGALQTGPFGSQLHKDEYQEDGIAVVNPTHLAGNRINHENVPRVSEKVARRLGKHRLRKFDILFARRGEIGRQGLVNDVEESWLCGTGCFLVRASKPFIDNRFLALYFATDQLVKWLYSHAAGAIMPNLNNSVMQRLPVFYPDLETQTEIIETFATIDQKLSAAIRRESEFKDLFRTLLHELMTAKTCINALPLSL